MFEEVTSFIEKVLISTRCIRGFMSYSIKKSRKDSSRQQYICGTKTKVALLRRFFVVHYELYLYLIPLKQSKALTVYFTCHTIVRSQVGATELSQFSTNGIRGLHSTIIYNFILLGKKMRNIYSWQMTKNNSIESTLANAQAFEAKYVLD